MEYRTAMSTLESMETPPATPTHQERLQAA